MSETIATLRIDLFDSERRANERSVIRRLGHELPPTRQART
jgi:hypothetical protein